MRESRFKKLVIPKNGNENKLEEINEDYHEGRCIFVDSEVDLIRLKKNEYAVQDLGRELTLYWDPSNDLTKSIQDMEEKNEKHDH